MTDLGECATLSWLPGDVPVSERFADPYYSREDGLAESRHVFLDATGLATRMRTPGEVAVAELGFGTGLNFAATLALWQAEGTATLRYTTFENWPLASADIDRALARWPELDDQRAALLGAWTGAAMIADIAGVRFELVLGDARETVPRWSGVADAWYLDGFAPARNPEMWTPALLQSVHDRTRPGGAVATYSAAGHVRRALAAAGFRVEKRPGFGTKREMLCGVRPPVAAP